MSGTSMTAHRGQMSFAAVSLVSQSASLANGRAMTMRDGSGLSSRGLSVAFVPTLFSSRTCRACARSDCDTCWPTLPASGSMRSGVVSGRRMSGLRTFATASSFFPMPTAQSYGSNRGGEAGRVGKVRLSLESMARQGMWPTPTVKGNYNRAGLSKKSGNGLATVIGGPLNPPFVEWLMGYPIGWTDCELSGTP